jgi:hypothetical protein
MLKPNGSEKHGSQGKLVGNVYFIHISSINLRPSAAYIITCYSIQLLKGNKQESKLKLDHLL